MASIPTSSTTANELIGKAKRPRSCKPFPNDMNHNNIDVLQASPMDSSNTVSPFKQQCTNAMKRTKLDLTEILFARDASSLELSQAAEVHSTVEHAVVPSKKVLSERTDIAAELEEITKAHAATYPISENSLADFTEASLCAAFGLSEYPTESFADAILGQELSLPGDIDFGAAISEFHEMLDEAGADENDDVISTCSATSEQGCSKSSANAFLLTKATLPERKIM